MPSTIVQNTPVGDAVKAADQALQSGFDMLNSIKSPQQAARSTIDFAKEMVKLNSSITQLDAKMKTMEADAPGTLQFAKDTAALFDKVAGMVPKQGLPGFAAGAVQDLQKASASLSTFIDAYQKYEASCRDWIPFNEAGKALTAKKAWDTFRADFDRMQSHLPPIARDPVVQGTVQKGAEKVLETLYNAVK